MDEKTKALNELLDASTRALELWDKHGLGDDEDESWPVYTDLKWAIKTAARALDG